MLSLFFTNVSRFRKYFWPFFVNPVFFKVMRGGKEKNENEENMVCFALASLLNRSGYG